jgi:isorenieratene synthase
MSAFGPVQVPQPPGAGRAPATVRAVVVGGGIAGIAAATVLAERGVRVALVERERFLGGRAGAWTEILPDGDAVQMERGFHGFFRQYYNLRALLRRIDPGLELLQPLRDYPVLTPDGLASFADLPRRPPASLAALVRRTPGLGLGALLRVGVRPALEMVSFDPRRTYEEWDGRTAREYLDALRFPPRARRMLFDVFAHSFFNPEEEMSAAELLAMFHFYFLGNPEGLVFDVCREPFSTALWEPMGRFLEGLDVEIVLGRTATRIERDANAWRVEIDGAPGSIDADAVVLATTVRGLQAIVEASPALGDAAWRRAIAALRATRPFAVWRLWLDRPLGSHRAPFVGTAGFGPLDNISLYHLFQGESRRWAERTGGAVVELHAYAVPDDLDEPEIRSDLLGGLHAAYPETREARLCHDRFLLRRDCPAFPPGSHATRPGVETPSPGVALAGDFVRLPLPTALMERAATSGFLAANHLLARWGVAGEPVWSVPARGVLAWAR